VYAVRSAMSDVLGQSAAAEPAAPYLTLPAGPRVSERLPSEWRVNNFDLLRQLAGALC
jgi:hypothetical protein